MSTHAQRLYRLAARAYPPTYLAEHGDELIATACELQDDRLSVREALGLVKGGMRTRARAATTGSGAGIWVSGLRLGLLFLMISQLAWILAPPSEWNATIFDTPIWVYALSIAMVAGLAIGTGRWYATFVTLTTLAGWGWAFFGSTQVNGSSVVPPPWWLAVPAFGLLVATWWLALKTDGRRVISPLGAVVVSAVWSAAFTVAPGLLNGNLFERTGTILVLVTLILIGLAVITIDPRLMAGTAVFFAFVAAQSLTTSVQGPDLRGSELLWLTPELSIVAIMLAAAWFAVRRGSRQLDRV